MLIGVIFPFVCVEQIHKASLVVDKAQLWPFPSSRAGWLRETGHAAAQGRLIGYISAQIALSHTASQQQPITVLQLPLDTSGLRSRLGHSEEMWSLRLVCTTPGLWETGSFNLQLLDTTYPNLYPPVLTTPHRNYENKIRHFRIGNQHDQG